MWRMRIVLVLLPLFCIGCISSNSITSYIYKKNEKDKYEKIPVRKDIQKGFGFKGAQFMIKEDGRTVSFEQKDVFDNAQDIIGEIAGAVPTIANAGDNV